MMWKSQVTGKPDVTYVYDGAGRRVKMKVGTKETLFVYNAAGALVGEYVNGTRETEYVYGPSGLLAKIEQPTSQPLMRFVTPDHLGSTRIITGANSEVIKRYDFFPFGAEIEGTMLGRDGEYVGTGSVRQRFTSYERDAETGLDFA